MKTTKRLATLLVTLILVLFSIVVSVSADAYPESNHSYTNNMDQTWTYTHSDTAVDSLKITFSAETKVESSYDYIYIYTSSDDLVGKYTGTELAGQTIEVSGSGFKVRLTSDSSNTYYGFSITSIEGVTVQPQTTYPESDHNYAANTNKTWSYVHEDPSVDCLAITFNSQTKTQSGYDYIYIYTPGGTLVGKYSGTELAGKTVYVAASGFKIKLTSNGSTNYYGFKIDDIVGCARIGLNSCTVTMDTSVDYTGSAVTPSVTVTDGSTTLVNGTDYTVSYEDNVAPGTAKAIVTGIGRYTGTVNKTFKIVTPLPESAHNYASNTNQTWIYVHEDPNADYIAIKFNSQTKTESRYDYIYIYTPDDELVGKYSGTELAGKTVYVTASGFKIKLTSDYSSNYYGFKIDSVVSCTRTNLSSCTVTVNDTSVVYTSNEVTTSVTVTDGSTTLENGTDYTVSYENNVNVGTAKVVVTGIGRYTGTVKKSFKIVSQVPESDHNYDYSTNKTWAYAYSDQGIDYLKITFNSQTKTESKYDYIYIYTLDDELVGKYTGTELAGKTVYVYAPGFKIKLTSDSSSNYYGFKIDSITGHYRTKMSACTITVDETPMYHTGKALKPSVTVKDGSKTLVKGTDYTVSYENNVKVGTAKVVVTGTGLYTGTAKKSFTIINPIMQSAHNYANNTKQTWSYTYSDSSAQCLKVKFSSKTEVENKRDYIYIYNAKGSLVGKYTGTSLAGKTIVVKGNKFKIRLTSNGSVTKYGFKIDSVTGHKYTKLSKCTITLSDTSVTYNGSAHTPSVTVKDGSTTLVNGIDYKLTYSKNTKAGTAKVKITGMGAYTGSVTKSFTIKKLNLSTINMSIPDQNYTGKAIKPAITIDGKTLPSSNYKVKYSSNKNVGTATATITAKGSNVSGKKVITFKILPTLSDTSKNLFMGKTFTLKLNGVSASKVTFSSSDTSICTVSSKGVVTAITDGDVTIYAKYNGVSYPCAVKVLDIATSDTETTFYQNHDDVPDFGALLKIEPTKVTTSQKNGDSFVYSLSDLQNVDPNKEAGDKYMKLLKDNKFTKKSGKTKISGKTYYKFVSQKKIVYFGIASKNKEVKIIIKLK